MNFRSNPNSRLSSSDELLERSNVMRYECSIWFSVRIFSNVDKDELKYTLHCKVPGDNNAKFEIFRARMIELLQPAHYSAGLGYDVKVNVLCRFTPVAPL